MRSTLNALPTAPDRLGIVLGEARQVLREARAALVCSGTATLEAALMRCPMVITYRVSPLSAFLIRRLIRIPFVGLVNIVAGRAVCPERLQEHAVGRELAAEIEPLLTDDTAHAAMQAELDNVRRALGAPGAAARAADIVAAEIGA